MPTRRPQFADTADEIRSVDNAPFSRLDRQIVVNDPAFEQLIDDLLPTSRKAGVNRRVLSALVANLIRCWWDDPDAFIALPMSNRAKDYRTKIGGRRNRYNPAEVSNLIIDHVDILADKGLIDRRRGGVHPDTQQRVLTRIRPDVALTDMFEALPVSVRQSVALHPSAEFIILRDEDKNDINYTDTDQTRAMRRRLVDYNRLLDRTFIDIPSLGYPPVIVTQNKARRGRQPTTRRVTVSQSSKRVYRIFSNGDWDQGGRFWRGFWMNLRSEERRLLHINNEPTIELDYAGLHPVLLYAEAGVDYWEASDRRPYETIEVQDADTGELISTDIIKVFLLIMLNAGDRSSGFKAVRSSLGGMTGEVRLTDGLLDRLLEAIRQRHPIIGDQLGTGVGNRLMNVDGRITDIIIDTLTRMDIPVLSIHDSYIVARQHEGLLRQTMESAYRQVTGMDQVMIDRKDVGQDQSMTIDYERRYRRFMEALGGHTGTDSRKAL
jgi:hypothetical protein